MHRFTYLIVLAINAIVGLDHSAAAPVISSSIPQNGYVDPRQDRDGSTGELFGIQDVSITFSVPVSASSGAALSTSNFQTRCVRNRGAANDLQTGLTPTVTQVSGTGAGPYALHLSSRICLGAWTEIKALNIIDSSGAPISDTGNRIVLASLPLDLTQDGRVRGDDLNRWLQIYNGLYDPTPLTSLQLIDQNRDGTIAGSDINRTIQLLNGIGTYQAWADMDIGPQPEPIQFVPLGGNVRLDLALPGVSRSFVQLWSIGVGKRTSGIATSSAGVIYTTTGDSAYALSPSGSIIWATDCTSWGGCKAISTNASAVFVSIGSTLTSGGVARLSRVNGAVECLFSPGNLSAASQASALLATSASIVYATTGGTYNVSVIDANTCVERYRLSSPNGEKPHVVASETLDRLLVAWDDAGGSSGQIHSYRLSNGQTLCNYLGSEYFRLLIYNARNHGGWNTLRAHDINNCTLKAQFPGSFGDVRDIAANPTSNRILALTSNGASRKLFLLDGTNLMQLASFSNFYNNGILSLNKMAVASHWAFVPDGSDLSNGRVHVLDWNSSISEYASFDLGRVTRLADRIIDGGMYLTQVQRTTDTPLFAYKVGDGEFVGHSYLYGTPEGNKFCERCLTLLRRVEMTCDVYQTTGYRCTLNHNYEGLVGNVTLAGLPSGTTWNVALEGGSSVATGIQSEVQLPGNYSPNDAPIFVFTPG